MPLFVILAFLPNLAVWRIFEPNRANPRVKHSVSIHIGPGWAKISKLVPKKVLLGHFLALKRQKRAPELFFFWLFRAKLSPIHGMNPKKLKSETLQLKVCTFSLDWPSCVPWPDAARKLLNLLLSLTIYQLGLLPFYFSLTFWTALKRNTSPAFEWAGRWKLLWWCFLGLVWRCYCIFFTFVCLIQKKDSFGIFEGPRLCRIQKLD